MSKTTVGDQIEIFKHYVAELELDKILIQCFEQDHNGSEPGLSKAKASYDMTRKRALEPLDFMLQHREQLCSENVQGIEKTRERFLEKYPKEPKFFQTSVITKERL